MLSRSSIVGSMTRYLDIGSLPDGSQASLGHRRLSIIDTSAAGHQPMVSQDGRYAVTFNGEIYN